MSGVMEEAEHFWALGLDSVKGTSLCSEHFTDKYVKKHINEVSVKGYCDYCLNEKRVVSLENFMIYIMEFVNFFSKMLLIL